MQILNFLFYLYYFCLPIIFFKGFPEHFEFVKLIWTYFSILTIVLVLSAQLFLSKKGIFQIKIGYGNLFLMVFLLPIIISTLNSKLPAISFWGFYPRANQSLIFFIFMMMLVLLLGNLYDRLNIKKILSFALFGLAISAFYGIAIYIYQFIKTSDSSLRVSSTESNPIFYGMMMIVGFYLSIALETEVKAVNRILPLILKIIFFLGILISFSRGAWVSAMLPLAFVLILKIRKSGVRKVVLENKRRVFIGIVISFTIFGWFHKPIIARIAPFWQPQSTFSSHYIRSLEISEAVTLLKNKGSIFGIGPGMLGFYYPKYRSSLNNLTQEWSLYPEQVRNNYLNILISFGYLGFLTFLLVLTLIFSISVRHLLKEDKNTSNKQFYLAIFLGWIALNITGLFYFYNTFTWIMFWTFVVVLVKMGYDGKYLQISLNRGKSLLLATLVIASCFYSGFILFKVVKAETYYSQGALSLSNISYFKNFPNQTMDNSLFTRYKYTIEDQKEMKAAYLSFQKAVNEAPYQNFIYARWYIHALTMYGSSLNNFEEKKILYNISRKLSEKLVAANPYDPLNFGLRSNILYKMAQDGIEKEKNINLAIDDLINESVLDPSDNTIFDNLGLIYRDINDLIKAEDSFKKSISLKRNFLPSYIHLGEVLEDQKKIVEAKKYYQMGLQIDKTNEILLGKIVRLK